ncbi:MAG TPA: PD-(D/E)XK nuclease family protein, partial [Chthoniobacterales bacterium]|nr:PD-(D/E)XK nuclease family protein [Chthoniobacterales bacterium]
YAKVCVATAAEAHGTSWDCVILADSVADAWPVAPAPNPLLSEEAKIRLRQQRHFILTTSEQRAVQEERYLQVAYAARNHLILARYEQDEKGVELVANNLSTFSEEFLKASVARVQSEAVRIQDDLTARFTKICESRADPGKPFDDYFLNFKGIELPSRAWHPSELETVFKTPGTFAFRLMFDCGREIDRGFIRSASMTLGRITHRLLQRAFAGNGQFSALEQSTQWSREEERIRISQGMEVAFERMRREFMAHGSDLWWETILGKAFTFAWQILDHVSDRFEEGRWYQSEATLTGAFTTSAGALKLEGRTDLILSDLERLDSATVSICDFKTSRRIQRFDADSGENLQFLGYRLLAQVNGALRTEILIVRPDRIKRLELPPNEALTGLTELLARLQEARSFGRRPPEKWELTEKLPIATRPIDPGVLQRKLELTWN